MAKSENTPLWLDLKKQYIDDNFANLQEYLKRFANDSSVKDAFYEQTIKLYRERISELLVDLSNRPLYAEVPPKDELVFNSRMLATYLLSDPHSSLSTHAYIALLGELRLLNPRYSDTLIKTALKRIEYENVVSLGFSWNDLSQIGTELFVYNACKQLRLDGPLKNPLFLTNRGTVAITSEGMYLTCENINNTKALLKTGSNSLDTDVGISLRLKSDDKLKAQYENDLSQMNTFVKNFISHLSSTTDKKATPANKEYFDSDELIVQITEIDKFGTIHVKSIDTAYIQIQGTIKYERPSLCYYYTNTLFEYFNKGDYLKVTLTDKEKGYFCFDRQLVDFFVNDTRKSVDEENVFLAKLIDEKDSYYGWINTFGIAMFTKNTGDFRKGDFACLAVEKYQQGEYYGKIDARIIERSEEDFNEKEVRRDCIRAFVEMIEQPAHKKSEDEIGNLNPALLYLILRQMYEHQKTLLKPSERFRFLCNANVMAHIVGDESSASYLKFASTYLLALVKFVNYEDIHETTLIPDSEYADAASTKVRLWVLDILKEFGKTGNSETLADAINAFESTIPMLAKLARLVQTANSMQDILTRSSLVVIRREIIKTLSLETEDDADLEADSGKYIGIESGTQEFKTSMVYPPDNKMQPDEAVQNINVMKAICAFLNSQTGGTLYIGVNDQGYVCGLENDMKYLNCPSIDNYMRYVQDTAMKQFGKDVLPYLHIESLYNNDVVSIHVDSHPYRVVEMNGRAYLRVNAESREMPEQMKQQLIDLKIFRNKEKAAIISYLQHSITLKKCVMLHNYASSNSGVVSDRLVEAYEVYPNDGLVICFDRNNMDTRVFNINRIGYVEILDKEPWKYPMSHTEVHVDVFHMSGDKPIPVSLKLDLFAKNLLVEEFPRAEKYISLNKNDEGEWFFTTDVYRIEGVGRFYAGLANHIEILDAPELKEYIAEYVKSYLQ